MKPHHRLLSFVNDLDSSTRDAARRELFSEQPIPHVASRPDPGDDLRQRFRQELEVLGGEILDATSQNAATLFNEWLTDLTRDLPQPLQVAVDPQLTSSAPWLLRCLQDVGCEVAGTSHEVAGTSHEVAGTSHEVAGTSLDTATLARVDLGVTLTDRAVAETGTLVETPRPGRPRALSLLPPRHLAILPMSRLVADLETFFDFIDPDFDTPEGPFASYFTCISGPSRTADIEKVLTVGVHGPGRLTVLIVDDAAIA